MRKRTYVVKEPLYYRDHEGHRYPIYEIRDNAEISGPIFPDHYIDITPLARHAKIRLSLHMLRYRIRHNRRVVLALARLRRT